VSKKNTVNGDYLRLYLKTNCVLFRWLCFITVPNLGDNKLKTIKKRLANDKVESEEMVLGKCLGNLLAKESSVCVAHSHQILG